MRRRIRDTTTAQGTAADSMGGVYRARDTRFDRDVVPRAQSRRTSHVWPPIHQVGRRYSSLGSCRSASSSHRASRVPRRPHACERMLDRTLKVLPVRPSRRRFVLTPGGRVV